MSRIVCTPMIDSISDKPVQGPDLRPGPAGSGAAAETGLAPVSQVTAVAAPAGAGADPFAPLLAQILHDLPSENSRRSYTTAIEQFRGWVGNRPISRATLLEYRAKLQAEGKSAGTINTRLASIRKLMREAWHARLIPFEVAEGIREVKGVKGGGERVGNWLSAEQAERLINTPVADSTKGARDRALLSVLVGCALRRAELSSLLWTQIQQRDGKDVIVDVVGKGNRRDGVYIPILTRALLDVWKSKLERAARFTDPPAHVFVALSRDGLVTADGLSGHAIYEIVRYYSRKSGVEVRPHDLRRTAATMALDAGATGQEVQTMMRHASLATTDKYIKRKQAWDNPAAAKVGFLQTEPKWTETEK